MGCRRDVLEMLDVLRPSHAWWIARSGDHERSGWTTLGGVEEQTFQQRLTIRGIRPHVAQVPPKVRRRREVVFRVKGAIERPRPWRAVTLLECLKRRTARKRQVQVVARNLRACQIRGIACLERGEGDWRVDVVERRDALGGAQD